TQSNATDVESGTPAVAQLGDGDWSAYGPVNFTGIDSITFRVASGGAGGTIELRQDGPDGELLATAEVPDTGGTQEWRDVTIDAPETTESMDLHLVYGGSASFSLNFIEFNGKGIS